MKKIHTLCALVLLLASCSEGPVDRSNPLPLSIPATKNTEYIRPLANGNVWWYITPIPEDPKQNITRRDTIQITGEMQVDAYRIAGDMSDTVLVGTRTVFPFMRRGMERAYALLNSGVAEGELSADRSRFYYNDYFLVPKDPQPDNVNWFAVPSLTVLAGTFSDLIMYRDSSSAGVFRSYFKKGVGLVLMQHQYPNSGRIVHEYELQHYNLK